MRYLGLIDPSSSVYNSWRVPDPTAPYPQDYIIDQQGRVAYWNDQFDPQDVIATIDRLLLSGVSEPPVTSGKLPSGLVRDILDVPQSAFGNPRSVLGLFDAGGRQVLKLRPGANDLSRLVPGVYFIGGRARIVHCRAGR